MAEGGSSSLSHILNMLAMISTARATDRQAKNESGYSMNLNTIR